ncbi:MAG: aminotransferase class III-fold pyridoxal phosphate-dependent enzyme [Chloroflexota bacterium]
MVPALSAEEIIALTKKHTFFSWSAQNRVNPIPMARAEGVYFWDANGKRYLDFNSQLMCVNVGHSHPRIIEAIKKQADTLVYAGPNMATEVRAELGRRLAQITPGNLNVFFFTLGGAEANENALKLARFYTGRHKVITRYRSYHGASHGAMMLTGDPRRWASEPGMGGVVRVLDPYRYRCSFCRSQTACTLDCLNHVEEVMMYEGPPTVAAVLIETVTGTNGLIVPPDGYLQGLRALCDRYGILLICDEVMCGLGRTGAWFAVDHWQVIPDMITMAKGLTSAYLPLGAVAMREEIAAYFGERVYQGGLTYNAHPMCLAAAIATLEVLEEEELIGNARRMGAVMAGRLADLKAKHLCVGDVRSIGLFGVIELVGNRQTREPLAPFNGSSPEMVRLDAFLKENGLFTFLHWNCVSTNPPLCITEAELEEGFAILDRGLDLVDEMITDKT